MPGFLMWNVQRKPLDALVLALVDEHGPDIVLLVERAPDIAPLEREMAARGFGLAPGEPRFALFHRSAKAGAERLHPPGKSEREDHWRVRWGNVLELLVVAVHAPDRVNYGDARRGVFFARMAERIRWLENHLGHARTTVMGDFNANPFEHSMVGANGMHAVPVTEVGGRYVRTVMRADYPFFYNPMWGCHGKQGEPRATHYFNGSDIHEVFWHMLDQVIVRPGLAALLPERRLRIVASAGGVSLLNAFGHPDEESASDHLPLVFRINRPIRRKADA